jgi:hypothetical protein
MQLIFYETFKAGGEHFLPFTDFCLEALDRLFKTGSVSLNELPALPREQQLERRVETLTEEKEDLEVNVLALTEEKEDLEVNVLGLTDEIEYLMTLNAWKHIKSRRGIRGRCTDGESNAIKLLVDSLIQDRHVWWKPTRPTSTPFFRTEAHLEAAYATIDGWTIPPRAAGLNLYAFIE